MNQTRRNGILTLCQHAKIIGLSGFVLFLPYSIAIMQTGIMLLFLAYVVEATLIKTFRFPTTPINRPLFTYIAVTILVSLFLLSPIANVNEFRSIFVKFSAFYLVYLVLQDRAQVKKCVKLLVLAITIAAAYGVLQYYLEVDLFRLGKSLALLKHVDNDLKAPVRIPGFTSYMTFSGQLAMMIPILWALLFAVKTKSQRVLLFIAVILTSFALLWTFTRSAWVGTACALAVFGYFRVKKFSVVMLLIMLLLLIPFVFIVVLQPDTFHRSLSIFRAEENLERVYTWESTLHMIKDHPLLGIGKGNYSKFTPKYRIPYGDFEFTSRAHAHNNILQVAVEGGIFSLLSFLWLWGMIFREMYRTYQQIPEQHTLLKWLSLGFLCAIVAFFVQGFFEHNWGDSENVTMMWLITALSLKLQKLI